MAMRRIQGIAQRNTSGLQNGNRRCRSPGSKGKGGSGGAGQALLNKVERLHDSALESIERGGETVKGGFKELLKFIRCHETYWERYKKQLRKNVSVSPVLPPTWTAIEEFVMIANSEMVLRAAAIDFQQDIQWLFHEALRFLGPVDQMEGLLVPRASNNQAKGHSRMSRSRSGSHRSTTSVRSASSSKGRNDRAPVTDDLSGQAPLKKALKGIVVNNQAVLRWMNQESIDSMITMLQRALGISEGGPFCTVILYNLAVCYIACGKFDEAVEALSHCLQVANGYLQGLKPPSLRRLEKEEEEKAGHDKRSAALPSLRGNGRVNSANERKGIVERGRKAVGSRGDTRTASRNQRGTVKGTAKVAKLGLSSSRPGKGNAGRGPKGNSKGQKEPSLAQEALSLTEDEQVEIARKRRLIILRQRWKVYSTYVVMLASHSILCHHSIATLAVWCEKDSLEQHHCELALNCAKKFLPAYHYLQSRCRDRLCNAVNFSLPRVRPAAATPPQLPLLSLADFSATPCSRVVALPDEENPFSGSLSVVASYPTVRISDMLNLITSVSKPPEITEFVLSMVAEALSTSGDAAANDIRRTSSISSLPRLIRGGSQTQTTKSNFSDTVGSARQLKRSSSSRFKDRKNQSSRKSTRRKSKGNGESKLPPLERLLPPIHTDPPVAADGRPQYVTVLPRIAYERYYFLNEGTVAYLTDASVITSSSVPAIEENKSEENKPLKPASKKSSSASPVPSFSLLDHSFRSKSRRDGILASPPMFSRSSGRQISPTQLMMQYDDDLHRMSHLVKDLLPEVRFRAAQMIQRQWRYFAAHLTLERELNVIQDWKEKMEAASNIIYYYKRWKERFPSIIEARRLRYLQYQGMLLTKVQSFLFQMQSVEEWGRRCLRLYQRLLAEKQQREKEAAAATMIQSVWRMCRVQSQIVIMLGSATRIQTQWRCHKARKVLLEKRVHKKLAYEVFLKSVEGRIVYIQRWYRACKARKAVAGILKQKKKEVSEYLSREEEFFDRELGDLMDNLFLEMNGHKIMSVLRGAKTRKELFRQWKARQKLQLVLGKYILRRQGEKQLAALREEKAVRDAHQRRREEVENAVVQIQCVYRQHKAREQVRLMRECFALMDTSASRIQYVYKLYCLRKAITNENEKGKCKASVHEMHRLRIYAATRIQALWRGHQTRQEQRAYLNFMLTERHQLATKIQCAWRKWKAVSTARGVQRKRAAFFHAARLNHCRSVSATKIASVVRMFLVRKSLSSCSSSRVIHTNFQRCAAARRIQCAWRCYASKQYVHQLRLSTAYSDMEKVTLEAQHAYATLIQAVVRGRILNPFRMARIVKKKNNEDTEETRIRSFGPLDNERAKQVVV